MANENCKYFTCKNNKMKKVFFFIVCLISKTLFAQDMSYSKPGKSLYQELPDHAITLFEEWAKLSNEINVSFVSDNVRYPKKSTPLISTQTNWNATAWKGEKIHTQILVWTKRNIPDLSFQVKDLVNEKGDRINSKNISMGFVRYVMTDEFGRGCDHRKPSDYDSSLVEDPIDIIDVLQTFSETELNQRKALSKPSTFYTACDDEHPNGHSYSPPAENAWISWYASSAGFTGYLRWAYNNWAKAPLLDTRFRTWPGGENYQIYPGPRSSIRFEQLKSIPAADMLTKAKEQLSKF